MKEELKLKRLIRNYLNMNDFDVSKADDLIDECEAEQTFAEFKDGSVLDAEIYTLQARDD